MRRYSALIVVLLVIASARYVFVRQGDSVGAAGADSRAINGMLATAETSDRHESLAAPVDMEVNGRKRQNGRDRKGEAASLAALTKEAALVSNVAVAAETTGSPAPSATNLSLKIRVSGLRPGAAMRLALFDKEEEFPDNEHAIRTLAVAVDDATTEIQIDNLSVGTYAAAVFQDLNGDEVLNRSAFGVPSEPYGFSNNARGMFGPPSFQAAAFRLTVDQGELDIRVE